jgi:hypothetical protein
MKALRVIQSGTGCNRKFIVTDKEKQELYLILESKPPHLVQTKCKWIEI